MSPGLKLRFARESQRPNVSQYKLAAKLGITRSRIASYETEVAEPPEHIIEKISELWDIPAEWFYNPGDARLPVKTPPAEQPSTRVVPAAEMTRAESLLASGQFVAIPVWRGAICGSEDEFCFEEESSPSFAEISAFYTVGRPEQHVLCIASGVSMEPRIEHGAKVLIRLDPNVPAKKIVAASNGQGSIFLKRLVRGAAGLELHSLNDRFPPITSLAGWTLRGGVTMIQHPYNGAPNIEWDEGRFLGE